MAPGVRAARTGKMARERDRIGQNDGSARELKEDEAIVGELRCAQPIMTD